MSKRTDIHRSKTEKKSQVLRTADPDYGEAKYNRYGFAPRYCPANFVFCLVVRRTAKQCTLDYPAHELNRQYRHSGQNDITVHMMAHNPMIKLTQHFTDCAVHMPIDYNILDSSLF